jgi:membrane protease YdiL (CAAX protease family)
MMHAWTRLPVAIRAVLTGLALLAIATVPWGLISWANLTYWPQVPWAIPPAAFGLWIWWRYIGRRTRIRPVPDEAFSAALVAGILGIATALILLNLTNRVVDLPQQAVDDTDAPLTLLFLTLMGSAVAGVVEEASFRGFMQHPMESAHGPAVAVVVTSVIFGLAHFTHPGVLPMLPFYVAIGATYGVIAYLTGSIIPSLTLHAAGDALGGITALARGRSISSQPIPASSTSVGIDASFWISCVALLIVGTATVMAFRALAAVTHPARVRADTTCA